MDQDKLKEAEELFFGEEETPSFAKLLSFGLFDSERVLPYPQPPPGEKERSDKLCRLIDELEIDAAQIDHDASIPDSLIKELGDLGLLGLTIPKEYGGQGGSQYSYCRVVEQLARHCSSTALFVNVHQSIGLKALLLFGTEEQKREWLPRLASGKALAAFSLTEECAGSDAAAIETRAVYDEEKRLYRLTGRKQWTTNGSIAQVLTVMARTGDKITAFLVTPNMKGFHIQDAALDKVGMRGTATSNLLFDEMEVPEENVLGKVGEGLKIALTCLDFGRTAFGATCTGVAKECLAMAARHAKERRQFGQQLAAFPLIQRKLAFIAASTYAMESTTYLTASLIDHEEEDVMVETALIKIFASESLWQILYETMQIFGGRSFFSDMPLERMMRDARLNTIGEGANEVLRLFSGLAGMRSVGVRLKELITTTKSPATLLKIIRSQLRTPKIEIDTPELKGEVRRLSRSIQRLGQRIVFLLLRHREGIVDKQLLVDRVAEALLTIYTTTAVLSRLSKDPSQLKVGKLYCAEAFDRLNASFRALSHNKDGVIEEVSDEITGRGP